MMHRKFIGTALASIAALAGCRDSSTSNEVADPTGSPVVSGVAHLIAAKGTFLRLGSDDPQAALEERPGWTRLNHDFWMDTTEVTQKEFTSLLGRNPSETKGDDLPVTNVTWFDAVLAANARSRRDGLDTVYRYGERKSNPDGSVWDLPGLSVDLSRDGWRLPTEAEWELAARAGSTSPYPWGSLADSALARRHAWFQTNSDGTVHPVGTLEGNAWGLHDMAGNVMEWVQDWKGPFPDSSAEYAGENSPTAIGDKPVKGGSFGYGLGYLRPSSRSSTYASLPSSSTEYVGFRCVRGAISNAQFRLAGGDIQGALPSVQWNAEGIRSQFGSRFAKMVFVQVHSGRRFLSWIDFSASSPILRQFPQDDQVFHPKISPDGQWVAWSTVLEGSRQPGKIRIRRLSTGRSDVIEWTGIGAIPRWWVRPGSNDTFLVAASSAMDNTLADWQRGTTHLVGFSSGRFTTDSILTRQGAFHDGLSADGRYLVSGYRRLKVMDLRAGTVSIEFSGPANGKASGDTSQMCNVSIAPDSSGDAIGLDFGYQQTSSIVGRPYGIHEFAFRMQRDGRTIAPLSAPPGFASLEDLEWTNDRGYATASVVNGQGLRTGIWLFALDKTFSRQIIEGPDLWHPDLWIESDAPWISAINDSAGAYNSPAADAATEELANKLVRFWILRDSIQVAALGSSHTRFGIAPTSIRSARTFNFGAMGGPYDLSDTLVRHYLLAHAKRLKFVILEIAPGWMTWRDCSGLCSMFESTQGRIYDRNHSDWADSLPSRILTKISQRTWNSSSLYSAWGQFDAPTGGWGIEPTNGWVSIPIDTTSLTLKRNIAGLERLLDTLAQNGIKLLGVIYPQAPGYKNTPWAGKYEPKWPLFGQLVQRIKDLEGTHTNFRLYDAFQFGDHDYTNEDAYDMDHLSARGADKLSIRIDSILTRWK